MCEGQETSQQDRTRPTVLSCFSALPSVFFSSVLFPSNYRACPTDQPTDRLTDYDQSGYKCHISSRNDCVGGGGGGVGLQSESVSAGNGGGRGGGAEQSRGIEPPDCLGDETVLEPAGFGPETSEWAGQGVGWE